MSNKHPDKAELKYINRSDRKISHILANADGRFARPRCGCASILLSDWRRLNTISDAPSYEVCKICSKMSAGKLSGNAGQLTADGAGQAARDEVE